MSAIAMLDEEECYLAAIFDDPSGIELAEFCFIDEEQEDSCYRVWDFQWVMYSNESTYQIDQCARSLGKTQGIVMRAFAFPFVHPGAEMLITAPELNHLRPVTDKIENLFMTVRLGREMLPRTKGAGINHQPQFQARFVTGARIMSRLPNRDGKGVKGQHPLVIEQDECFPAGTLVLTRRGQVPIEAVSVGDQVLTHRNRWRRVTKTMMRDRETVLVRGHGHPGIVASANHKFWAAREQQALVLDGDRVIRQRAFTDPGWIPAQDLDGAWWCSPTTFPKVKGGQVPALRKGRRPIGYAPMVNVVDPETYWMVGLYLAEGSVGSSRGAGGPLDRLTFSIHEEESDEVLARLRRVGLDPRGPYPVTGTKGVNLVCYAGIAEVAEWLMHHCGRGSQKKQIASWMLGLPRGCREQLLAGLIYGDGHYDGDERYAAGRMKLTTTSKALAVTARLLGLSLGYSVSWYYWDDSDRQVIVRGRDVRSDGFYQVVFNEGGQGFTYQHRRYTAVREVTDLHQVQTLYDLEVEDDHTFIADGLTVSNSQDYPEAGWTELIETMKSGSPGAQWRAHGVSRGVRDTYYRMTTGENPDLPWMIHRFIAPHRPTWSDQERRSKIAIYGGTEDNVDYRRNIFGEHGDTHNPVFVLARLMACVRITESKWAEEYNNNVYCKIKVNDEHLRKTGMPIEGYLEQIPGNHLSDEYVAYWAGMDVGFTSDPSEILLFGVTKKDSVLRLLLRVQLQRISAPDQSRVIEQVFKVYGKRLKAFSLDKTGNGLPIFQESRRGGRLAAYEGRLKGYGFSEKRAVEFEDRPLERKEKPEDAVIEKNVVDYATDELRILVDTARLELPYDLELLTEWQGQQITVVKDMGSAGAVRRKYSDGGFHTLDAGRVMVLGKSLEAMEAVLNRPKRNGPVLDAFFA